MNRVHRAFDAWRGRASAGVSAAASALANAPENAAYGLLAMAPLGAALAPQAMMLTLVGVVDFPAADWRVGNAGAGAAGNSLCEATNIGIAFQAKGTSLFGQLVVRNPGTLYTPTSGEIITVDLLITQD